MDLLNICQRPIDFNRLVDLQKSVGLYHAGDYSGIAESVSMLKKVPTFIPAGK
jgi:hypothetical protein